MRIGVIVFLAGVLLFQQCEELPPAYWLLWLLPIVALAKYKMARLPLICLAGFSWAFFRAYLVLSSHLPADLEKKDVLISGTVVSIPQQKEHGVSFMFELVELKHDGERIADYPNKVRLSWFYPASELQVGDEWDLLVRLKQPHGFMNPGGFDFEGWLFQNQIRATGYVKKSEHNQKTASDVLSHPINRLRQKLLEDITAMVEHSDYAGVILALTLGERRGITPEQWLTFTRTGTNHLVAISGLHVGLVAGFLFFLCRWCWSRSSVLLTHVPAAKAAAVCAMLAAIVYAAMAGFSVPTQRALVMVAVVMIFVYTQRKIQSSTVLAVALFMVLVFDPFSVMSAGFWLSFGAVAIIMWGMNKNQKSKSWWWELGKLNVVVSIGLLPILLVLFQRVPLLSPFANFLAVPWLSFVVVPLSLLGAFFVELVPQLAEWFFSLALWAMAIIWPVLQWFSNLSFSQWNQFSPPLWTVIPAMMGMGLLLAPRGLPGRWLGATGMLPMLTLSPTLPSIGEAWVSVLDVGQGMSVVVRTRNHSLVYDTGAKFSETFNAGDAVILPFLNKHGVNVIDKLVISHGDNDHVGGASAIFDNIQVNQLTVGTSKNIIWPAKLCVKGNKWVWDEVNFIYLHPDDKWREKGNNSSCVLKVSTKEGSILIVGDIEKPAERYLLKTSKKALGATVMTVPHHGSKSSSTRKFIKAVAPGAVVYSTGYKNRYGFPKETIRQRYEEIGAKQFNTALQGEVSFKLGQNNGEYRIESFREATKHYWNDE